MTALRSAAYDFQPLAFLHELRIARLNAQTPEERRQVRADGRGNCRNRFQTRTHGTRFQPTEHGLADLRTIGHIGECEPLR
jgi:hypothetical protein